MYESGIQRRLDAMARGEMTEDQAFTASTSQICGLALALDRPARLEQMGYSIGDAWQRLDDGQRQVVRTHHPARAAEAEAAAVHSTTTNHGTHR